MGYNLKKAVWEVTYQCNMRCKHCGSGCGIPLEDELSTDEALNLCDDLGEMGLKSMTLSGGEPFIRTDWHLIAKRLSDNGVTVNAISNGWLVDENVVELAKSAGMVNIGISLDGLSASHDFMRKMGSFERAIASLALMKREGMPTVVCTTVNKRNLTELAALKDLLIENGVERWQFQIGLPMGNLKQYPELVLEPEDLNILIGFCHETMKEGKIDAVPADCLGYYSTKDVELRKESTKNSDGIWCGCGAGKTIVGIRADGSVTGCLSIRDDSYIEGNIRQTSLKELWTRPGAFAWNREFSRKKLSGFCAECQYGGICLGGCSGTKIMMHGSTEFNEYCLYSIAAKRELKRAIDCGDLRELILRARSAIDCGQHQMADINLKQALKISPDNIETLELLGFVRYFMGDYESSRKFNEAILDINPDDIVALRGYGLCLEKFGFLDEAIGYLKRSVQLSPEGDYESYNDLAAVLKANGRFPEMLTKKLCSA